MSSDPADWSRLPQLGSDPRIGFTLGLHPLSLERHPAERDQQLLDRLDSLLRASSCPVGECGLDGRMVSRGVSWQRQERVFVHQLRIARELERPVILHCVRAHERLLCLLRAHAPLQGVLHGFSRSHELARRYLSLGLHLGIGPRLLDPGARRLREAASRIPSERLLVETDAPYGWSPDRQATRPEQVLEIHAELTRLRGAPLSDSSDFLF